jgi:hypothetical protein
MSKGWIKLHRKLTETDGYFSEPFCRNMAWVDLLLLANHDNNFFRVRGVRVDVKRGQVGYSIDTLMKRWKWSKGKVLRFLNELENDAKIVQQKSRVITLISISKWNEYQLDGTTDSKTNSTTNGLQTVKQTDTNKNVENDKNVNNAEEVPQQLFEMFRRAASRKITDQHLLTEVGKFINKYPEPKNHTAPLVNAWCSRIEEPKPKFVM